MSTPRGNLQRALCQYTKETLSYIYILKEFSERLPEWINARKTELRKVTDIKDRGDSKKCEELEQELAAVLKDTLGGLEKLDCFLDAVERLAVTSLHVFNEENRVLHLPQDISSDTVQVVITAARLVCPLLLQFKRDAKAFFLPKLQNVEVLANQLDKYIQTTQKICDKLEESSFSEFCLRMNMETVVDRDVDLSEDDIQRMLRHINQLNEISYFVLIFAEGAKISSVAGSSVGAVGGVLSIIGLALIPVTAGVSLALTMTGLSLGVTSGVNSTVTTVTEIGVNRTYQNKASEAFQSIMKDVKSLQNCLDEVTNRKASQKDVDVGVSKGLTKDGVFRKSIESFVDFAPAGKMLKSEDLIASAGKVVARKRQVLGNMSRVASDVPDAGQAAVKGSLALTKSARAGLIGLNALLIGMDIYTIFKDSISLAKGSETEVSQLIRARAALCSSEMDSWKKIRDSLHQGLLTSEEKRAILETPFYPEGMDQPFRMVFLFEEESCPHFISEFDERQPRMLQFLNVLEESAVQLDGMNKGQKISSVAGSSEVLSGLSPALSRKSNVDIKENLRRALCQYTKDTFSYINTLKEFSERLPEWKDARKKELQRIRDIKDRADKTYLSIDHVKQSENKDKAFLEYMKSKMTLVTADSRRKKLEKELAAVSKVTLGGLEKLDCFLDAVEREELQQALCQYTTDTLICIDTVRGFCEKISKWMLERETEIKMIMDIKIRADKIDLKIGHLKQSENKVKALWEYGRSTVTQITADSRRKELERELAAVLKVTLGGLEKLDCFLDAVERLAVTSLHVFNEENWVLHLPQEISPETVQVGIIAARLVCPLLFQFKRDAKAFFLPKLQNVEVLTYQLDKYIQTTQKIWAKISSVAGSSVGVIAGIFAIVGAALSPVTAGVSLALTMTGMSLGVTCGFNSIVTTATEIGVNCTYQNKASEAFKSFMEDMQSLQDCPEEVSRQTVTNMKASKKDMAKGVGKVLCKVGGVGKGIKSLVDDASALKLLNSEGLIAVNGTVVAQEGNVLDNVSRVASDIPDIGQAAVKGPLALTKSARAGFIGLNALFIGMDIFFICKNSISLAKGSKTEVSQLIRARAALWRSEMDSWKKIRDSLRQGLRTSEKKQAILETQFYPQR
eukprot:superscaffoldBa00006411_g21504